MISLDPPEHTKLRKLISSGFTPRRINDLAGAREGTRRLA